jgi:pimeloyl-ACP methyl ester carboxylesterase
MKRLRTLAVGIGVLCLCAGAAASGAAAGPSQIAWSTCYGGPFQCGTVQVPLDYDSPNGATISLAVLRLPATDPAHKIGSLFLNPGGPGGSGVDFTLFAGPSLYTSEVRARFDLVGFDPRGIARSTAMRCFGSDRQWGPLFTPFAFPITPAEEQIWMQADFYLESNCTQRASRIRDYMTTANVARDLDVLRAAVGDAKLTYAGYSYGTFLGQVYANMFPANVRALIIDGVLDPIAWTTGSGDASTVPFSTRLRSDAGAAATLNEFFRLCDAGGARCAFGPNSAARFAALANALKAHPREVTFPDGTTGVVDYSNLIGMTLGAMYDSFSWEDFADALATLEAQAGSAALGVRLAGFWKPVNTYITKRGFPRYFNIEGFAAVICADSDNPHSYAAWSSAGAAADASFGYFGRIWTWISSICVPWSGGNFDRYMGPFNRRTANPVLVVGNLFDPATRYEGAVKAASLLPNSRLLTVHGWGHTSLFSSQCADAAAARYLVSLTLPAPGTVCEQDVVPFQP